ncbi:alpha/beta fold hydrolase [Georgenia sp. Z1344]|uniref:alpha/beta fold hydrolase n=1 Tax=Georgenia sp. Z1344 TaxID=3416706 RepID=UPI003CE8F9C9
MTDDLPEPTVVELDAPVASYVLGPERDDDAVATSSLGPERDGAATNAADVVLCHGTPWSSRVWEPVARLLARDRRVYLWDMPGYGASIPAAAPTDGIDAPDGSDGPPPDLPAVDLVAQRRRLAALLDHWGLERPHLVGHDIGGAVVLGAHLLEGGEAATITLLDIVTLDPWGSPFFRLVAEHEDVFAALPSALHRALVREYVTGAGGPGLDPALPDDLARPWTSVDGQAAFYRQIGALTPEHTRPVVERLGSVRAPTAIAWGEADPWIPAEQGAELARLLPGDPEVTLLPGVGHLAPLEATRAVARVIERRIAAK